jgi:uncharacterized membrane protein YqjE
MTDPAGNSPGQARSVRIGPKGLLGTGVTLLHNRLELLGVELAEERARLFSMLAYGGAAFLCLAAGLIFLAVFLTVLMWDSNRLLALGGLFRAVPRRRRCQPAGGDMGLARSGSKLFSASLAELRKDTQDADVRRYRKAAIDELPRD